MLSTLIKATKNHLKMSFVLLPNIIGSVKAYNMNLLSKVTGAFDYVQDGGGSIQSINGGIGYNIFNIDASRSSALYSTSETVQPSSHHQIHCCSSLGSFPNWRDS